MARWDRSMKIRRCVKSYRGNEISVGRQFSDSDSTANLRWKRTIPKWDMRHLKKMTPTVLLRMVVGMKIKHIMVCWRYKLPWDDWFPHCLILEIQTFLFYCNWCRCLLNFAWMNVTVKCPRNILTPAGIMWCHQLTYLSHASTAKEARVHLDCNVK